MKAAPSHPRVVIAEPFAESGQAVLRAAGIDVVSCIGAQRPVLLDALEQAQGLIVRSETRVDRELLHAANALCVVGRAGVGVDAIDVAAATQAGIVVLNTPAANTIAATEQTFALLLAALRHIPAAAVSVKDGRWERTPFIGHELFGKTLGIIGLGRIGGSVATRARAFGMHVIACDPYIAPSRAEAHGVAMVSFEELLGRSDIITLHTPLNEQTLGLIGRAELAQMKHDAVLVNCSRGGVIDECALLDALEAATLGGAAIDVVAVEPPQPGSAGAKLHAHPKVLATPHLGGSTHEALARIATELAADMVSVLAGRPADGAVNAPAAHGADAQVLRPYVDLAYRIGVLLPQVGGAALLDRAVVTMNGDIAELDSAPIVTALLSGILQRTTEHRISIVNADAVARERGIVVEVRHQRERATYSATLIVEAGQHRVIGTALSHGLRLIEIDGFETDAAPLGTLVLTRHRDIPGMIGRAGTILGDAGLNISAMQVARSAQGGEAMMVLAVDRPPDGPTLEALRSVPGMELVRAIRF
ncbi:MAG: phosphoglycerate dehydrogenase [Vulcanimicrobiaceae bacterium]